MRKRFGRPGKMRWRNRQQSQVFNRERQTPAPVHVLVENGVPVDKLIEAYEQANAGNAHGAATTLEEMLGRPPQGGDPPW